MKKKVSYDFVLILATASVLFCISTICIYGMFYFKFAQIQQMAQADKTAYMESMNLFVSPFLIVLMLLLGICVPKRLLPVKLLNRFTLVLVGVLALATLWKGVVFALKVNLILACTLQVVILGLALLGNEYLHFEKKGYWVRVGSSFLHLGIILFVLDLFYYQNKNLHLALFWVTTASTVIGMLSCFYAESVTMMVKRLRRPNQ